ncbi:glycosyltransferase family 2 protein [Gaoshiqia sp. Z1-71]|uniref:glycosyltransferase family 2 protein n=1 Tax=Gaoshiqia hydrogeniformans TaxID=3290090 RepID=UPI003BF90F0A
MNTMISIVISLYNEEDGVLSFWALLRAELIKMADIDFEVIWVNDGSTDQTQNRIEKLTTSHPGQNISHCSIEFSKNFGHESAMIAGIDHAKGDAVICMDGDGQHPPAEIENMLHAYQAGSDFVLMECIQREDNGLVKKLLSASFYKLINRLSTIKLRNNATDFFLISRQVADILKTCYREQNRFIRGFIQSIGFSSVVLPFHAPSRLYGKSNYSLFRLFKHAFNAIFAFSNKPLRISMFFSVVFISFTVVFGLYTHYMYLYGDTPPSGYTSIIFLMLISFSLLFFTITILSLYFEKVIQEMRQRPIYIIKNINHVLSKHNSLKNQEDIERQT